MLDKMSKYVERIKKNMATEQELKEINPLHKEFQILLDQDFKDRNLKKTKLLKQQY